MLLDRNDTLDEDTKLAIADDDRPGEYVYDTDDGRSNFVAFLLGGVVITGGLLTFLYYDTSSLQANGSRGAMLAGMEQPASFAPARSVVAPSPDVRVTR